MQRLHFITENWQRFRRLSTKRKLSIIGAITAALMILTPIVSYAYFVRDIRDPERLMNRNNTGIVITDKHGEVLYSFGKTPSENNTSLNEISDNLEQALIASEDQEFYNHAGFSVKGIAMALYANVLNKDLMKYGGSTLTQQLVKNNLLSHNKNFLRKYQELSIAIAVERHYSKDEILAMYLNSVYFGEGAFGIKQAAKVYFDKSPNDLTLAESSMLVAILPAPSKLSPVSGNLDEARKQQARVLRRMVEAGYISDKEKEIAIGETLQYTEPAETKQAHGQHFTQMVLQDLYKRYGEETITRSGFMVKTSLDLAWQKEAEKTMAESLQRVKNQGATNGSLVAIDPKNGEIRALVGSIGWDEPEYGQVNMAVIPRQPGSSFKPIYYTEALANRRITPATVLRDEPKSYGSYRPQNFDFRFRGDVPVRHALATSLNIPAIEVMQKVGVEHASATARRMGIGTINEPEKYGLTLALGTAETRLLDMTNAYAAFGNQGSQYTTSTIISIQDKFRRTIFRHKPVAKAVQSKEASYLISSILSDNEARGPTFGNRLSISGRQVAVKTGTTDENKDAWTIGYTPSLAVGVWVGDNTHKPMSLSGTAAAGPIWRSSMRSFLGDSPAEPFSQPPSVVKSTVCNGRGTYQEFFIRGSAPASRCETNQDKDDAKKDDRKEEDKRKKRDEDDEDRDDDGESRQQQTQPTTPTNQQPGPAPTPQPTQPTTPTSPTSPGTTEPPDDDDETTSPSPQPAPQATSGTS